MSKAYYRIEWNFLEGVMRRMGFAEQWIRLIMKCITSISYSVLINGDSYGNILPTRGLRQGDLLSPYLSIMCADVLSTMLQEAERSRAITSVPLAKGRVRLNHLFFVDDSLLFCKANLMEWSQLRAVLERYEQASGQRLNLEKTSSSSAPTLQLLIDVRSYIS
ncbi:hypothetical protein SLA2020_438100 [Shorea laevis]